MEEPSPYITEADITGLNQRALLRSTRLVGQASQGLLAVGLLLALGWLWNVVRYQQLLSDSFEGGLGVEIGLGAGLPWTQRVDGFAGSLPVLGYAAVVVGVALALRLYADAVTVREGANITPWKVGDLIEDSDDEGVDEEGLT